MTEAHVLLARTAKAESERASKKTPKTADIRQKSAASSSCVCKSRVSLAITFAASWQLLGTYAGNRPARPALLHHS